MSYDRLGRRAATPVEGEEQEKAGTKGSARPTAGAANPGAATPNAARLARGRAAAAAARAPRPAAAPEKKKRRPAALRILPVTAFVAALVLSFRVADLWENRQTLVETLSVGSIAAAKDAAAPQSPPAATAADPTVLVPPIQLAQASGTDASGTVAPGDKVDPFNLGKSQIELLQSLADRRRELEERERTLDQREGLLAAAEHRIDQKISELTGIKGEIEDLIRKYDKQEEDQLSGLVKIYETMKPKDAARIFDELDMDILLQVIERMKASKTASVLANMSPERAKEVTSRIAERKSMPDIN